MSNRVKLGEILVQSGVIDDFQLRSALGEQKRWGRRLGMTLIKMGFLEEAELVRALAAQLELPVARLGGKRIHREILELVPVELAEKHMCLPLFAKDEGGTKTLYLGVEDPCNLAALDDLAFRTGMRVKPVLVGPSELCEAIDTFYRGTGALDDASVPAPAAGGRTAKGPGDTAPLVEPPPARSPAATTASSAAQEAPLSATAPAVAPPAAAQAPADDDRSRLVLRAIAQLLIEKGVLGRAELLERVRALEDALDAAD